MRLNVVDRDATRIKKLPNSQRTLLLSLNMCENPGGFVGVNMSLHSAAATLTGEKDTEVFFVGGGGGFWAFLTIFAPNLSIYHQN